jgi:hypothetical protein
MGTLSSGAAYVYEREGGRTYARKVGELDRVLIGEDYSVQLVQRNKEIADEWIPIVQAAEHNPALQDALDRAKILYELTRKHNLQTVMHHPV